MNEVDWSLFPTPISRGIYELWIFPGFPDSLFWRIETNGRRYSDTRTRGAIWLLENHLKIRGRERVFHNFAVIRKDLRNVIFSQEKKRYCPVLVYFPVDPLRKKSNYPCKNALLVVVNRSAIFAICIALSHSRQEFVRDKRVFKEFIWDQSRNE